MTDNFHVSFQVLNPVGGFPVPIAIGHQTVQDSAYRFDGMTRRDRSHCIFQYTLAGEGAFRDAAGEYRLTVGRGFLCESDDRRTAYYYPESGSDAWTFVYLAFGGRSAHEMVRDLTARYGGVYDLSLDRSVIRQLTAYRSRDRIEQAVSASDAARLVTGLLCELAAGKEAESEHDPENLIVKRARDAIREFIDNNINVSDIAAMLDISREHLTRVFQRQTGITPYRYIVQRKMALACRLLKETDLSIKETAARLGYDTPAHFMRTFKRLVGMTPSAFRKYGVTPVL